MNNPLQNQTDMRTVGAFFTMTEADLLRFAEELGIQMDARELQFCQNYFKYVYRRPPIVEELRFIAAYLHAKKASPLSLLPFDVSFAEAETARAFTDLMQKHDTLLPNKKQPPNILSLVNVAGKYVKRAGHAPAGDDLFCGSRAELAALTGNCAPRLTLPLGDQVAVLTDLPRSTPKSPATILMIDERDPDLLPQIAAKIMEITAPIGVIPLMQVENEGLLPMLSDLPVGIEIFAPFTPIESNDNIYRVINDFYKNTLLITLPEAVVPSVLATGMPLKTVGKVLAADTIVIRHPHTTVSFGKGLLQELNTLASSCLHTAIPAKAPANFELGEARNEAEILCGATGTGDMIPTLLSLLAAAFKAGIKPKAIQICATLTCNKQNFTAALGMITDLHRVVTELALASRPARVIMSDDALPRLTVALSAPLCPGARPDDEKITAFENAATRADYAALRAFLY